MSRILKDEIEIGNWTSGIGISSKAGFLDMRNCDIYRKPGYLECALQMVNEADTPFSLAFTANAGTDLLTVTGGVITRGGGTYSGAYKAVTFTSSGTLPAPLVAGTVYFITFNGSLTSTVFNISSSLANAQSGTFLDITDAGTGTHTVTTVNIGTPRYVIENPSGVSYMQDSNARIWYKSSAFWLLLTGNTLTSAAGNGIAWWKNYLVVFRNTTIDLCGDGTASGVTAANWHNSWQTSLESLDDKLPFVSADGILYFYGDIDGTRYYVGSLSEDTVFDWNDSATYTFNAQALDIPDAITAFMDLGANLMIGSSSNKIYPWDRTSSSFSDPIVLQEYNVTCMSSLNNVMYFSCGGRGNIYYTYGTTAEEFIDLSNELTLNFAYPCFVNSLIITSDKLLFYLNASTASVTGIYEADLSDRTYHLKYKLSQGYAVTPYKKAVIASASSINNDYLLACYATGGVGYIDTTFFFGSNSSTATGYISYVITPLYPVGTFDNPRKMQKAQLILARPLTNSTAIESGGGSVRISSRNNLYDSFTQSAVFDTTKMGTNTVANEALVNQNKCQFIQFKIELQSGSATPGLGSTVWNTPTIDCIIFS